MYPVLIGPLHTFGVMVLLGVLAGLWWVRRDAPRLGFDGQAVEDVISLAVEVFLAGLIGSRLQFVIHNWEHYSGENLWRVLAIWQGGLVWYGGLLAALPVAVWRIKHYGFPILRTCDLLAPCTMLGLAIGRIGCLMAGDDHGRIIIESSRLQEFLATKPPGWMALHDPVVMDHIPWYALTFTDERALVGEGYLGLPLLPSQPLMTIGCLAVFGILVALRRPLMKAPGAVAALLFVLYPIHRFLVEFTRGDLVRGHLPADVPVIGGYSVSQAMSLLIVPFGLAATVFFYVRGRREWDRLVAEGKDPLALEGRPSQGGDPAKQGDPARPAAAAAPAPEPPRVDPAPAPAPPASATQGAPAPAPEDAPAPDAPAPAPTPGDDGGAGGEERPA